MRYWQLPVARYGQLEKRKQKCQSSQTINCRKESRQIYGALIAELCQKILTEIAHIQLQEKPLTVSHIFKYGNMAYACLHTLTILPLIVNLLEHFLACHRPDYNTQSRARYNTLTDSI